MLAIMLYAHVCSVWCAFSMGRCDGMSAMQKEHCTKSCCSDNHKTSSDDCQTGHVAFFGATGKFFTDVNKDLAKPFQPLASIATLQLFFFFSENNKTIVAYDGFHPPPPPADIRISISSFQI